MATQIDYRHYRFVARSQALLYARLSFLFIGFIGLIVPDLAQFLGIERGYFFLWYLVMLAYAIATFIAVKRHFPKARHLTYDTLVLDLAGVIVLIISSGGLRSPVMTAQLLFTVLFALLYPRPRAIIPPLLIFPIVAYFDIPSPSRMVAEEIFLLLWYASMDFLAVYVVVYLNRQEALQNRQIVHLQKGLKEHAVNEERLRLARDIHDGLGASLSGLLIQAEYLSHLTDEPTILTEITELRGAAQESIDELRRSIMMLRSDFDLIPCLEDYCMTFQERSHVWTSFVVQGEEKTIPGELQLTIFRILQESLTNVGKHAAAHRVEVVLDFQQSGLTIIITDDGVGFDPSQDRTHHYGLINMRERARQYTGRAAVESTPGNGTRIEIFLPWERKGDSSATVRAFGS